MQDNTGLVPTTTRVPVWMRHVGVVGVFLLFGVANNVSSTMMGYVMPIFPSFLLYWTTLVYTIMFYGIAWYRGQKPFTTEHRTPIKMRQYYWLGAWTAFNGLCFQFSNVWLDGPLQQLLINLSIPITFVINRFYFPQKKYSWKEKLGYGMVLVGIIVGVIPSIKHIEQTSDSHESDNWYWILVFIASVIFSVLQEVQQDYAFDDDVGIQAEKAVTLFWFNLLSLPIYILTIPMESVAYLNGSTNSTSIKESFVNQQHAFLCYFNTPTMEDTLTNGCLSYSWLWPNLFCIAYAGYYFLYAVVIGYYGVVFATVLTALVTPIAALIFSSATLVGAANQKDFDPILGGAFAIIFVGVCIKSIPLEWIRPYIPSICHPYFTLTDPMVTTTTTMAPTTSNNSHGEAPVTTATASTPLLPVDHHHPLLEGTMAVPKASSADDVGGSSTAIVTDTYSTMS